MMLEKKPKDINLIKVAATFCLVNMLYTGERHVLFETVRFPHGLKQKRQA